MNISRGIISVALLTTIAGCQFSTAIDVVALVGIWTADAIVYTDNSNPDTSVNTLSRDGASWQMTIRSDGAVAVTFDDGLGNVVNIGGYIDQDERLFIIDEEDYIVVRDSNRLTLSNAGQTFQFDASGGLVPATIRIELGRI